jgi:hypothetical protein
MRIFVVVVLGYLIWLSCRLVDSRQIFGFSRGRIGMSQPDGSSATSKSAENIGLQVAAVAGGWRDSILVLAIVLAPLGLVSAPTSFSPKSNDPNVDIQRRVDCWGEPSRDRGQRVRWRPTMEHGHATRLGR